MSLLSAVPLPVTLSIDSWCHNAAKLLLIAPNATTLQYGSSLQVSAKVCKLTLEHNFVEIHMYSSSSPRGD